MDVEAIGGWDYEHYGYDQDSVYAIGFKGKGKAGEGGKGKGDCYSCGSAGHFSRERLQPYKGKAKAKDSKENATNAEKFDIQPETKRDKILTGASRQRSNHARRQMSWIKTGTRSSEGAASSAQGALRSSPCRPPGRR